MAYVIDSFVTNSLSLLYTKLKYDLYVHIVNTIDELNNIQGLNKELDLDIFNLEIINVINRYKDYDNETIILHVDNVVYSGFVRYLNTYGIKVSQDIKLYELASILEAIKIFYTLDKGLIEPIELVLEDTNFQDDIEKLSHLLSQYSEITLPELYSLIEEVDIIFFTNLEKYYSTFYKDEVVILNEEGKLIFNYLVNKDKEYLNTLFLQDIITNGYTPLTIDKLLPKLYHYLETHHDDITKTVYEIVCCFYLAIDTRGDIHSSVIDKLIFDNVPAVKTEILKDQVLATIEKMSLELYKK